MSEELGTLTAPQETITPVPQLVQCQQLTALSALYKELIRTRAVRKYEDVPRIAAAIKAKYSFRQAARALHVPFTTFMRMCSVPKAGPNQGRKVTAMQKEAVTNFIE